MHIVALESESSGLMSAIRHCRRAGQIVSTMDASPEGVEQLADAAFDLLLVDAAGLGSVSRALGALRSRQEGIAVAAIGATGDAVADCLDQGADIVVADGCDRELLLASIFAAVRRVRGFCRSQLVAGALELDIEARTCSLKDRPIALSDTEFRLLEALLLRRGQTVSRQTLLELLYEPGSEPQARTIDLFVHRLRWKLVAPRTPAVIETRRNGFALAVCAAAPFAFAA